jgi:hypothetical protein
VILEETRFSAKSGEEPVMKETLRFLGLDVHAETSAIAEPDIGARARFFQYPHTITAYVLFPSWHSLIYTLASGKTPLI